MIVKKIIAAPALRATAVSRAQHVRALVDYMREPDKPSLYRDHLLAYVQETHGRDANADRLQYIGSRNFVTTDIAGQRAEMMACVDQAFRSPNPLDHWLLSWPTGELPTRKQIEETVDIFLATCGVASHQCIFAVHGDTHNRHLHLALNRYDPITGRTKTLGDGWITGAPHQAIALIEQRFGWMPEEGRLYEIDESGAVVPTAGEVARRASGDKRIGREAAVFEIRTGQRSGQRFARDVALPIILAATSWQALHHELAEAGFEFRPEGINGAKLWCDGAWVAASKVSREITLTRLERKLGSFEAPVDLATRSREPNEHLMPSAFRADEYRKSVEIRRGHRGSRSAQRGRAIDKAQDRIVEALAHSGDLDWAGREEERDLIERTLQRVAVRWTRRAIAANHRAPPDYESWLRDQGEHWFADRWRHRRRPADFGFALEGIAHEHEPHAMGAFVPYAAWDGPEACVRYARAAEPTAFIERATRIDVVPAVDDEAIVAALKVALEKFPKSITVSGPDAVRERIIAVARAHGLADRIEGFAVVAPEPPKRPVVLGLDTNTKMDATSEQPNFEDVIARILDRRSAIVLDPARRGRVVEVEGLSSAERNVLFAAANRKRLDALLGGEAARQHAEIDRLLAIVGEIGSERIGFVAKPADDLAREGLALHRRYFSDRRFIIGQEAAQDRFEARGLRDARGDVRPVERIEVVPTAVPVVGAEPSTRSEAAPTSSQPHDAVAKIEDARVQLVRADRIGSDSETRETASLPTARHVETADPARAIEPQADREEARKAIDDEGQSAQESVAEGRDQSVSPNEPVVLEPITVPSIAVATPDPKFVEMAEADARRREAVAKRQTQTGALLDRIELERLPIEPIDTGSSRRFAVPALTEAENSLLDVGGVSVVRRLADLLGRQRAEIAAVVAWIETEGQDPAKLDIAGRTAKLGSVPPEIRSALKAYQASDRVRRAFENEAARRADAHGLAKQDAAQRPAAVSRSPVAIEASVSPYPLPSAGRTPHVRRFIELLREARPDDAEIKAAAKRILREPAAREDMARQPASLREIYEQCLPRRDGYDVGAWRAVGRPRDD